MTRLTGLRVLAASLLACSDPTQVLSDDGSTVVRMCRDEDSWNGIPPAAVCFAEACPHGLVVLPRAKDVRGGPVVRCLRGSTSDGGAQ